MSAKAPTERRPARSRRPWSALALCLASLLLAGCALVPRTDLPRAEDLKKGERLPIDGVWRLEENGKRYRIEGGRVWIMDRLVVGPVFMDPGQVTMTNVVQTGPTTYTAYELGWGGPFTGTASASGLRGTVGGAVPAKLTLVPLELDDPAWYRAQLEADTKLAAPPPGAGARLARFRPGEVTTAPSGEAIRGAAQREVFGRYHAVVIGNNAYRSLPQLVTASADARAVAALLERRYDFEVTLLEDATRAEILTTLRALRGQLTPEDNLLIYYAGHGWLDEAADEGYWLPVDADADSDIHWISNATITGYLRSIQAKHIMVVADSCYSGTLTRGIKIDVRPPDYLDRMAQQRARIVLSSGGLEPVVDGGGGGHSAFARHFLDALEGNSGVLDSTTLYSKIRRPIMLAADQAPELADIRKAGHEGGDFLFIPADAASRSDGDRSGQD